MQVEVLRSPYERWIEAAVVVLATAFVVLQVHPGSVLASTTPTGGDLAGHVWGPHALRTELLPSWRLSGWSPDWFSGMPTYTFYPVLPALLVVILDVVLPYTIAFKLVVAAAIVGVPIAAWAFGRLAGLDGAAPALCAVGATGFVFDTSFTLTGGNLASTMTGEFSYALGMIALLVYLGFFIRWLRTEKGSIGVALWLAAAILCHPVVAIYAVVGTVAAIAAHGFTGGGLPALRGFVWRLGGGALLSAFWVIPYFAESGWTTSPNFAKYSHYRSLLFPYPIAVEVVLGALVVLAVAAAIRRREAGVLVIAALAVVAALAAALVPRGHLWNLRLQPAWLFGRSLLAALGVGELFRLARRPLLAPIAGLLAVVLVVGTTWGILPGLHRTETKVGERTDLDVSWPGLPSVRTTYVRTWAKVGFDGYERYPGAREFERLLATMRAVGHEHGCGTAMWEYDSASSRYGSPLALTILPYATDGCIRSGRGLWVDSSATDPYFELAEASLSLRPLRYVKGLPYGPFNPELGVQQLRVLGVRYFMARSPQVASGVTGLLGVHLIARSGPWRVFEVVGSDAVAPLGQQPVVLTGTGSSAWKDIAINAFASNPTGVPIAADGPPGWQRVAAGAQVPFESLPTVDVTNIREERNQVSFDVDRTGVPVVVRVSDFAGWKPHGASGPWRLAPNLMVVVPTSKRVTMAAGRTAADELGTILTIVGFTVVAAGVFFERRKRRPTRPTVEPGPVKRPAGDRGARANAPRRNRRRRSRR